MKGVWALHPRICSTCHHRWHYAGKCQKRLSKKIWMPLIKCDCPKSTITTIKQCMDFIKKLNETDYIGRQT